MTVILDGKVVEPTAIDATQHQLLGWFRPPEPPRQSMGAMAIACDCGEHLFGYITAHEHWRQGHFDIPQYQTVEWPTLLQQLRTERLEIAKQLRVIASLARTQNVWRAQPSELDRIAERLEAER